MQLNNVRGVARIGLGGVSKSACENNMRVRWPLATQISLSDECYTKTFILVPVKEMSYF